MTSEFNQRPLYATSVTGLRGWRLNFRSLQDQLVLGSIFKTSEDKWQPGECVASCQGVSLFGVEHPVGSLYCTCGFYAYWGMEKLAWCSPVCGVIEGYGVTTTGSLGFRSSHARIVALCSSHHYRTELGEQYGVPVFTDWREMVAAHPLTDPQDFGYPEYRSAYADLDLPPRLRQAGEVDPSIAVMLQSLQLPNSLDMSAVLRALGAVGAAGSQVQVKLDALTEQVRAAREAAYAKSPSAQPDTDPYRSALDRIRGQQQQRANRRAAGGIVNPQPLRKDHRT